MTFQIFSLNLNTPLFHTTKEKKYCNSKVLATNSASITAMILFSRAWSCLSHSYYAEEQRGTTEPACISLPLVASNYISMPNGTGSKDYIEWYINHRGNTGQWQNILAYYNV